MVSVGILALRNSNWRSVFRMIKSLGHFPVAIENPTEIEKVTHLILPGVGAFGAVVEELKEKQLFDATRQLINTQTNVLGLCVGMQIMGRSSEESPGTIGFSWFEIDSIRLASHNNQPKFHTGWNFCNVGNRVAADELFDHSFFFNHAYGFPLQTLNSDSLGVTTFHGKFISFLKKANVMGAQFHPEKSQYAGRAFLKYFLSGA